MGQPQPIETPTPAPQLAQELAKMEAEPLLPAEKKLIVYSLLLGVALLGLLWLTSVLLFGQR